MNLAEAIPLLLVEDKRMRDCSSAAKPGTCRLVSGEGEKHRWINTYAKPEWDDELFLFCFMLQYGMAACVPIPAERTDWRLENE